MIQYTHFSHCPRCAADSLEVFRKNGIRCSSCGYIIFHNMAAAVACIVEVEDKIVLIRRAHEPRKGFFDLPGGFVDYHESLEEALAREVREEISVEITDLRYFGSAPNTYEYEGVTYFTSDAFFIGRPVDASTMKISEENSELVVIRPGDVDLDSLAFKTMQTMIARYRDLLGAAPTRK